MATIIEAYDAGDGFDVAVDIDGNGRRQVFHFPSQPENVQGAVDSLAENWKDPELEPRPVDPRDAAVAELSVELESSRQDLSGLAVELDRSRQDLSNLKLKVLALDGVAGVDLETKVDKIVADLKAVVAVDV